MKRTALNSALPQEQVQWAADKAKKAFPKTKLGLVGVDAEGNYYFQEFGNASPFILNKFGKKVAA